MSNETVATRRSVLQLGALLAMPGAAPAAAVRDDDADEAAIYALHRQWMRLVNAGDATDLSALAGNARRIAADPAGAPDMVEVAADGRSAVGRFACTVERETEVSRDCTFGQMAHAQGCGHVRETAHGVLATRFTRSDDGWAIASIGLALEERG